MHSGGSLDQIPCSSQIRIKKGEGPRSTCIVNPSSQATPTASPVGNVPLGRMCSLPSVILPFTGVGSGHVFELVGKFWTEIKNNIFHH